MNEETKETIDPKATVTNTKSKVFFALVFVFPAVILLLMSCATAFNNNYKKDKGLVDIIVAFGNVRTLPKKLTEFELIKYGLESNSILCMLVSFVIGFCLVVAAIGIVKGIVNTINNKNFYACTNFEHTSTWIFVATVMQIVLMILINVYSIYELEGYGRFKTVSLMPGFGFVLIVALAAVYKFYICPQYRKAKNAYQYNS